MVQKKRRVALLVETATTYGRSILEGIAKYQRTRARWSAFMDERELGASPPEWLLQRPWDGIICRNTTPELAAKIRRKGIPTVDLNDLYADLKLPRIQSDMHAIGRLGASHLYERGFRNFAFCGFEKETWSEQRFVGFSEHLRSLGFETATYHSVWRGKAAAKWDLDQERIAQWLQQLPKPVGLMACNDIRAQQVLNACQSSEIFVPEQVAVIGVDNDELLCNFCDPPLSSIQPNPQRIGFEAAELLDELMSGQKADSAARLVDPMGVIVRQSTDALGIDDDLVVEAIAMIRESACFGMTAQDLVGKLGVSRSSIERRFRQSLGHSPQQEIRATQLRRIKELLRDTNLSLAEIAKLTGFDHTEYMTVVFKRLTGIPPSVFREDFR
ncbi:XylR family transcriptional regulator [Rhodopirellula sp. MGV]|uniref:XylR family transcriptional regulator n=1 Tax=Rhodopirellula sp. MGV TaxID=2023130 RepID=UPI000B9610C2|nr:XylR family transcriptional regulator [Rhodopirellula sp. MGV]OYP35015.1 XylR family transcriptional regulator [Rhodopirellula sp. MGV]PNY38086.1 xylose operon transcription regulator XylR [Rhodopirellula baltica]